MTLITAVLVLAVQQQPVTIRASTVLDGKGNVLRNTSIVVAGSKIVAVDPDATAVTYDLTGFTVMPGGIDTHVHISSHFDRNGRAHNRPPGDENPQQSMLHLVENAYVTLMSGITTAQSIGLPFDRDLRDWIDRGTIPGPRLLTSLGWVTEEAGGVNGLRAAVEERVRDGADLIKIFASKSIREAGVPTLTEDQLRAACGQAQALGRRAVVHAHAAEAAQRAIRAGCDQIEHGILLDEETLRLMAQHGVYYDPHTHLVFSNYFNNKEKFLGSGNYTEEGFAHMERSVPIMLDLFQKAIQVDNLKIVFGTDALAGSHGHNFEELIYRVERGGQDPMSAIVSATSLAAQSLGMDDELGSIAPGMEADIIAVDGDPLRDITALRRVVFVMRAGMVYKNQK